jgi:hypothetical protein
MEESNCNYVSSRGLLKSCDVRCENLNSSTEETPHLTRMFDYCTLYICNSAINVFAKRMIEANEVQHKFILVSGDADQLNYEGIFATHDDFLKFINNDNLIHWFSQNCDVTHPKITQMPIGLDYHSILYHKGKSPLEQEQTLIDIKNKSETFDKRIHKCYINFNSPPDFYTFKQDRVEALRDIPDRIIFKEKEDIDRIICWENQIKYTFVVSPFGNGLDCHRTWEALILGCIVIMKKHNDSYSKLFDDLPVLIVDNWSDINEELLERTINDFKTKTFNYDKLKLKYWTDQINSYKVQKENFEPMVMVEEKNDTFTNPIFILLFLLLLLFIFVIIKYKYMKKISKYMKKYFIGFNK